MLQFSYIFLLFTLLTNFSDARKAQIIFSNNDSLTGEISAIRTDSIDFSHSSLSPSGDFQKIYTSALHKIIFKDNEIPEKILDSHVSLTNRDLTTLSTDLYKGAINNILDDKIILDTNFAGKVQLKKQFIQSLKMFNPKTHLVTSLGNINTWKKSSNQVETQQVGNSFIFSPTKSKSSSHTNYVYRQVDLPDRYYVDIQLDDFSKNSYQSFKMYLNSDEKGSHTGKGKQAFAIGVTPYGLNIQMTDLTNRLQTIRNKAIIKASIKSKDFKLRVYVNIPEKNISIYLNEQLYFSNVNINFLNKELLGKHISLGFSRNKNNCSISNFKVTKWTSGELPYSNTKRIALNKIDPNYSKIKFHNGDFIYGEILSIDNGEALIKNQFGKFRVKLTNLTDLDLGNEDRDLIFMDVNDTRFKFSDGSSVIAKTLNFTENKVKVESQVFEGELEFDINQMTSIEFTNSLYPF